jgi:glycosyltransferase involved in cell wall biosynthesis
MADEKGNRKRYRVGVTVPAYNEEANIDYVLKNIPRDYVDDIVVVDDNSTDSTYEKAKKYEDVIVIRHDKNRGCGAAIKTGYKECVRRGDDIVVVVAGDGQYNPAEIPQIIAPIINGEAEYVVGNRLWGNPVKDVKMPLHRYIGNCILTFMTKHVTGLDIKDSQSGYTAITKEAIQKLDFSQISDTWGYNNGIFTFCALKNIKIKYVPIRVTYAGTRSYISISNYIPLLLRILCSGLVLRLRLATQVSPLKIFLPFGFIFLTTGVLLSAYTAVTAFNISDAGVMLISTGVQIILFALLADAILQKRIR